MDFSHLGTAIAIYAAFWGTVIFAIGWAIGHWLF